MLFVSFAHCFAMRGLLAYIQRCCARDLKGIYSNRVMRKITMMTKMRMTSARSMLIEPFTTWPSPSSWPSAS